MKEILKTYEPQKYEDNIYKCWEESGFFNPDVCVDKGIADKNAETFSIALPPPNVTGTLHIGHAVMLAVEDVMIRYHRMKGDRTLWLPGTDHAAVATEAKVEKMLIDEGMSKPKEELGRDKFLEKVNKFAKESHDTIINQSKKMGASLDWTREAFTLDKERNFAVRTVFKKMYEDGLIYRGWRVINWSVKGQSTCSDDELVHVERQSKIYYFKYSSDFPISIATTRPETKLGDTAVAVNPNDERYKKFIGKIFTVDVGANKPLEIKIIADDHIDMEYGTGAVGVTPAHSTPDFEIYLRNKNGETPIDIIQVIGEDGLMTKEAGENYKGLTTLEAREKFIQFLKENNLLEKEEDIIQNVGTSDRFGDVVEALPKTQWFIDVNKSFTFENRNLKGIENGQDVSLKELMQTAVRSEQIEILPERFLKIYFNWIDNLRDWCISRQIWYGHRIPVWYCKNKDCDAVIVSVENITICTTCGEKKVEQDSDSLDTWFSAGIWTFSTLGWPQKTEDLKNFHPTTVMETGYDIIFFWVARMILMSTYVLGEIPFKTVYLHGLVRDEKGRKMSKSVGNVIDPLDVCSKYGTDAVRLSLLIGMTPGNDTNLSIQKIESFRNFANKLWNISRFILLQVENSKLNILEPEAKTLSDKWILSRLHDLIDQVTDDIEKFRFSTAGEKLRDFTWNELADWYLEIAKIEGEKSNILNYILNTILKLWHPFMPFVTEALWSEMYGKENFLLVEKWPARAMVYPIHGFDILQGITSGIRGIRNDYKVPQKKEIEIIIVGDKENLIKFEEHIIKGLAKVGKVKFEKKFKNKGGYAGFIFGGIETYVDLSELIDIEKEVIRIEKEISEVYPYVETLEKKLSNKEFIDNAPEEIVFSESRKLADANDRLEKLKLQLKTIKN